MFALDVILYRFTPPTQEVQHAYWQDALIAGFTFCEEQVNTSLMIHDDDQGHLDYFPVNKPYGRLPQTSGNVNVYVNKCFLFFLKSHILNFHSQFNYFLTFLIFIGSLAYRVDIFSLR